MAARRIGTEATAAAGAGQAVIPAEDQHFHLPVPIWLESAVGSTLEVRSGRPCQTAAKVPPSCLGRRGPSWKHAKLVLRQVGDRSGRRKERHETDPSYLPHRRWGNAGSGGR